MIQRDLLYSIGTSHVTKIITLSDPTRKTDHLDHDSSERSDPNRIRVLILCLWNTNLLLQIYAVFDERYSKEICHAYM